MARRGAEPAAANGKSGLTGLRRSDRFLAGLQAADRIVFVSHIHPDPDSLGSMLGLTHLVETKLDRPTLITRDGLIGRAENRALVDVLHFDLTPIEEVRWAPGDAVVMVDSQPKTGPARPAAGSCDRSQGAPSAVSAIGQSQTPPRARRLSLSGAAWKRRALV